MAESELDGWVLDFARRVAPPESAGAPTTAIETSKPVIRTPDELDTYVWDTYGVRIPRTKVCDHHQTPWDAFCAAYFVTEERSVIVIKGSRGLAGKSFLMALLGNVVAATTRGDVTILGGSAQQSNRVHDAQAKLWASPNAPRAQLVNQTTTKTTFVSGNTIEALTASQKSVRGPHPLMLILDEVDEMEQPLFDASMGQTMDQNGYIGRTVAGSTHQYADGTMTTVLRMATERGWPVFEWCVAADTLIATPTGQRRINSLRAGDAVYSFTGKQFVEARISDAWSNGVKPTVRVVTSRGVIECTAEHKVLTVDRGWVEAGRLRRHDRLRTLPEPYQAQQDEDRPVLDVLPESIRLADSAKSGHNGVRMQWPENSWREAVLAVLSRKHGQAERRHGSHYGASQRNFMRRSSEAEVEARNDGRRSFHGDARAVQSALSDRTVHCGLLPARLQLSSGNERLVASAVKDRRIRRAPYGDYSGGWIQHVDAVGCADVHVVEIVAGRAVDVWDVAVPGWHNFVAAGIVVHNCYRETMEPHGWLTASQVRRKRNEMTSEMWRVEVELGEPSITGRAIATEKVERMFIKPDIPGLPDGSFEYTEFEPPMESATYAHGRDWARTSDFVAMVCFRDDVHPMRLVAYTQFRRKPTPYILAQHERMLERYPGRSSHDATSLGGKMMDDLTNPENADLDVANVGITMVGRVRQNLFTDYIIAVEQEELVAPRILPLYGHHKFVTNDDLRPRGEGHPPDGFVACCMAYSASGRSSPRLRVLRGTSVHPSSVVPREIVGDVPPPALPPSPLGRALLLLQPKPTEPGDDNVGS